MRARNITATAVSTLAAAAGMAPIVAHAASPVNLVVNTPDRGCSDADPSKGFCTVNAALASPSLVPGSSITINGDHPENVTITQSGITLGVGPWGGGTLSSVTVSGAQNVTLSRLWSTFTVTGSSNVTLHQVNSGALTVENSQGVAVDGNSRLTGDGTAVTIQNSGHTTIAQSQVSFDNVGGSAPGITVTGSSSQDTALTADSFFGGGSAVSLTGGSRATIVADDEVESNFGSPAFTVSGSTLNDIVGNTVRGTGQAIVATGGSTGLTVANNILFAEIDPPRQAFAGPLVVLDGTSTAGSAIHTGQGGSDYNVDPQFASVWSYELAATSPAIDSADSSVPGWQSTDYSGAARFQDPHFPTGYGAGPVPYADRGAVEFQGGPSIAAAVKPVTRPSANGVDVDYGFEVDLSGSQSLFAPVKSYNIGDYGSSGATSTGGGSSPAGTVWYPGLQGLRSLMLSVTDTAGHSDQIFVDVYVGPRKGAGTPPPVVIPPVVNPPSGTAGQASVRRIGGTDRYQTSRMVSQAQWGDGQAGAVVLARGDAAPDALTGVPLAAKVHGPLLLTDPTALAAADRAELDRVLGGPGTHKVVYILGGTAAVSPGIEDELRRAGYTVRRLYGIDRFGTALAVASQFGATSHVIVATGFNFPDALAAGPLGAVEGAPIVLSQDASLDPDTAAFVKTHVDVDAVGLQAYSATKALAGHAIMPLYGQDRYQTAEVVAIQVARVTGHKSLTGVGVASGKTFPDALTGGAFAANAGLPLLLTDPAALSFPTSTVLLGWAPTLASVTIFGGPSAVSRPVADQITRTVGGKAAY